LSHIDHFLGFQELIIRIPRIDHKEVFRLRQQRLSTAGNLQEFLHMGGSKKAKYQDAKDDNM
jgi:hypothetical protein